MYDQARNWCYFKQLRLNAKMTQKQVAQAIGRNQPIIGHWETGYAQPDADTLFALCNLYNVSVDEAFGFSKRTRDTEMPTAPIKFTEPETLHIKKYRALDERGKKVVDLVLDEEYKHCAYIEFPTAARTGITDKPSMPLQQYIDEAQEAIDLINNTPDSTGIDG